MKVLVCGGREFNNWGLMCEQMEEINKRTPISTIIHGDAKGADRMSEDWARLYPWIWITRVPANWKLHGKKAGPIRNQKMLDDHKPDLVVAFPGGRGTADMVNRAKAAGVRVLEVSPSPSASA